MTNRTFRPLLLEGAQLLREESRHGVEECAAYDEDLMMTVDSRTRFPLHRIRTAEAAETRITKVARETTDDD